MKRQRIRFLCATVALAGAMLAGPAGAQTDHFKCYKIKDVGAFKTATADIIPSSLSFVGENCSLKGKAATLCVPASKTNVNVVEPVGSFPDVSGDALTGAVLCYKAKCPSADAPTIQVNDQFGTRNITKGKVAKICGPVVEQ